MQERLLVLPNPYTFIDGDGEAMGACPADPAHAAGKRMWVGAKIDVSRTKYLQDYADRPKVRRGGKEVAWSGDARPRPQTTKFSFVSKPVDIPATPHYLDRIRCGELIAADKHTFAKAFGASQHFVPPEQALAEARRRAFDDFKSATGAPPRFTREGTADAPKPTGEPTTAANAPAEAPEGDTP